MNNMHTLEAEREKMLMNIHTYAIILALSPILGLILILIVVFLFLTGEKFIRARRRLERKVDATITPPTKRDSHNQ